MSSYIFSSTIFGSIISMRSCFGSALYSSETIIEFRPTDFPAPVAPATSRWGMRARSVTTGSPWMSLPSASDRCDGEAWNVSVSTMSRRVMISRRLFGTSMPTVEEPLMRSMRIDSAFSASARSSPRFTTFAYFTPADGLNSNVVTTGPGW